MGVRFLGIGREKSRSDRRRRNSNDERQKQLDGLDSVLGALRTRAGEADRRSGMSVRDLFGSQIDRRTDNIRQNANATKSNIARLGAARGGDPTGGTNVALNRIDENTNSAVGDVMNYFQDRTLDEQSRSRGRGDQLLNLVMGGRTNLLDFATRDFQTEISRNLQRKQANKQLGFDVFETLVNAIPKPGGAGGSGGG